MADWEVLTLTHTSQTISARGLSHRRRPIFQTSARTILSRTSGFISRAGFSRSLNPARNCTYGCSYCYVPTLRVRGGLKPLDWQRWGRHTTFKANAAALLRRELRATQVIYCSPLVDPYQPAEVEGRLMPEILRVLCDRPPATFVVQTRGPLVLRDLDLLGELATRTRLRISFSLTTDRDELRRLYEPLCASIDDRVRAMRTLRDRGIAVHCTLAPILPCSPERLADLAIESTSRSVIADPLHNRWDKPTGATTREQALRVSQRRGFEDWHNPARQAEVLEIIRSRVESSGREFGVGESGFGLLTR